MEVLSKPQQLIRGASNAMIRRDMQLNVEMGRQSVSSTATTTIGDKAMTIEEIIVSQAVTYQYIVVWVGCCSLAFIALCAYCNSM